MDMRWNDPLVGWRTVWSYRPEFRRDERWSDWVARGSESAILASFTVTVLLVAWDQHIGVSTNAYILRRAPGRHAKTSDLSAIVDCDRKCQLQTGVGRNQAIQIDHGPILLPEKRMLTRRNQAKVSTFRCAHDLTARIDVVRVGARIARQSPEI